MSSSTLRTLRGDAAIHCTTWRGLICARRADRRAGKGCKVATFDVDAVGATRGPTAFNACTYYEVTPAYFVIDANVDTRLHSGARTHLRNALNAVGGNRLTSSIFGHRELHTSAPRTAVMPLDGDF
ncbi:hypothetical protein [Sphingomonas sp. NFX23]|uniref:hypothetical protein n=1 Tax=Sphingomonas sp. NFX23 TaxID=2819532 RepID=UPI003CF2167B